MQREILGQRSTLGDAKNQLRNMHTEIHECVQFIQDPQALKAAVKKIYQRHVSSDLVSSRGVEPDIATEYARQRDYLEKTVNSLKRKLSKDTERHRVESMRIMQENVALIKEINELRREMRAMKAQAQAERLAVGKRSAEARAKSLIFRA